MVADRNRAENGKTVIVMPKLGAEPIRKAALINAAISTVGRAGSLDVTVAQIARAAGILAGLLAGAPGAVLIQYGAAALLAVEPRDVVDHGPIIGEQSRKNSAIGGMSAYGLAP